MSLHELSLTAHKTAFNPTLEQSRLGDLGLFHGAPQSLPMNVLGSGAIQGGRQGAHRRIPSSQPTSRVLGDCTNTRTLNQPPTSFPASSGSENLTRGHSALQSASSFFSGGVPGSSNGHALEQLGFQDVVPLPVPPSAAAGQSVFGGSSLALNGELLKFIMPSGPRKNGEGVEDHHQGIISTVVVNESAILAQLTLLVAGFVIGPSGESIRAIIAKTGASIYSNTEVVDSKKSRLFYIEGPVHSVAAAMRIICAAVTRYKQLAEGQCSGHQVERRQHVLGVDFSYQPPPRSVVPYAAGLKISKENSDTYAIAANSHLLSQRYGCI